MSFNSIIVILVVLGICIYTASYGVWTWKKENRLGAVMLFILALSVLSLPVYVILLHGI